MQKFFNRFVRNEAGASAIEYGLIAALIAVALITVLGALSGASQDSVSPAAHEASK